MEQEHGYVSHLPSFYGNTLLQLHSATGLKTDSLNLIILLLLNSVIGCIYRRMQHTRNRHLFGMMVGVCNMYSLYGPKQTIWILFVIIFFYPICVKLRNPRLTFWLSQITLFATFIYIALAVNFGDYRLDLTTSLMGIVVRLHTLTWDLHDSDVIASHKKNKNPNIPNSKPKSIFSSYPKINEYRMKHACAYPITIFEYMSFQLFFVHSLCGSNLTINEFMEISDHSNYQKNGWKQEKDIHGIGIIFPEPSYIDILYAIFEIICVALCFLIGQQIFPFNSIYEHRSSDVNGISFCSLIIGRVIAMSLFGYIALFRYHFAWKCCDLCALTSGAAFSGVDYSLEHGPIIHWKKAKNINSISLIFAQASRDCVRNWNITVNDWLTYYVFFRVQTPQIWWISKCGMSDKSGKILITRVTAALFHGVYFGYYFYFLFSFFVTVMVDNLRKVFPIYKSYENKSSLQAILCYLSWPLLLNFFLGMHAHWVINLNTWQVVQLMQSLYWIPVWSLLLLYAVSYVLLAQQKQKINSKRL